jgi:hypothetical protein
VESPFRIRHLCFIVNSYYPRNVQIVFLSGFLDAVSGLEVLLKPAVPSTNMARHFHGLVIPMLLLSAGVCQSMVGQESNASGQRPRVQLNAEQIVGNLVSMHLKRAQVLLAYQSTRARSSWTRAFRAS